MLGFIEGGGRLRNGIEITEFFQQLFEGRLLRRQSPDGKNALGTVVEKFNSAVIFLEIVFHLVEARDDVARDEISREAIFILQRVLGLDFFDRLRNFFVLVRFGSNAQDGVVARVAFDLRDVLHALVEQFDHCVGDLLVELVVARFILRRKVDDRVVDEFGGGKLLSRRADDGEAFVFRGIGQLDARDSAFDVILDFAGNVAFNVEIVDRFGFFRRFFFNLHNVRFESFDVNFTSGEKKAIIRLIVGGDDRRFDTGQRGDYVGGKRLAERDNFEGGVERAVQLRGELDRRFDSGLRTVDDERTSRIFRDDVETRDRRRQHDVCRAGIDLAYGDYRHVGAAVLECLSVREQRFFSVGFRGNFRRGRLDRSRCGRRGGGSCGSRRWRSFGRGGRSCGSRRWLSFRRGGRSCGSRRWRSGLSFRRGGRSCGSRRWRSGLSFRRGGRSCGSRRRGVGVLSYRRRKALRFNFFKRAFNVDDLIDNFGDLRLLDGGSPDGESRGNNRIRKTHGGAHFG